MKSSDKENGVVLHLDPRGIIFKGGADVVSRQNLYGRQLKLQSKNLRVRYLIFSSANHEKQNGKFKFINVFKISKPTFNSILFAKESISIILLFF